MKLQDSLFYLFILLPVTYTDLPCLILNNIHLWLWAMLISGTESEGVGACVLSHNSRKLMLVLARVALSRGLT
jgi:hypothetical protein